MKCIAIYIGDNSKIILEYIKKINTIHEIIFISSDNIANNYLNCKSYNLQNAMEIYNSMLILYNNMLLINNCDDFISNNDITYFNTNGELIFYVKGNTLNNLIPLEYYCNIFRSKITPNIKIITYADTNSPLIYLNFKTLPEYKWWWDYYTDSHISNKTYNIKPINKYAYATLLMNGDSYLAGALTLAYSIRQCSKNIDIVCMITDDVSEYAKFLLSFVFDRVILVDYIEIQSVQIKSETQNMIYGKFYTKLYTKYNILKLTDYDKVLYLDSDTIMVRNCDDLFNLNTPAGNFDNFWANTYNQVNGITNHYGKLNHGDIVNRKDIVNGLNDGFVVSGSSILIKPNIDDFNNYLNFFRELYGNQNCYSLYSEQSICEFYNSNWYHIDNSYNNIPIKRYYLGSNKKSHILHYFNNKPWKYNYDSYPDMRPWYYFSNLLCNKFNFMSPLYLKYLTIDSPEKILITGLLLCKKYKDQ